MLWKLKREAGVSLWFTGHTKRKSVSDIATGEEYDTLTSNMTPKYFNAIKTKLHFLGVASVDRDIEKIKVKQKVGGDKVVGKVKSESRIITFRDDNFNIDSKSRFAKIVERIPLDPESFIEALTNAIKDSTKAKKKSTSDKRVIAQEVKDEPEKEEVKVEKVSKKKEEDVDKIDEPVNEMLLEKIKDYIQGDESEDDVITEIGALFKETGFKTNATDKIPTSIYRKAVKLIEDVE